MPNHKIELGYYKETREATIPDQNLKGILKPKPPEIGLSEQEVLAQALQNPIGTPQLGDIVKPGEKVVIVTSDITRPMPTAKVLPVVVAALNQAGIDDHDITVVFGLGVHRKHTAEEHAALAGQEMYERLTCMDSDPDDVVHLGETSRGTPVDIFRTVVEAERRICLGNIEYHYFAGFSGGMKAIMPAVSTRQAIQANHSRMVEDAATTGKLDGNPVREDIDEVFTFCPVDYMLNVVLGEDKTIINAFAGDVFQAHRAGCRYLDSLYKVELDAPADIVIVTPGGFPKDLNLYQAQKALDNSKHAVKEGGTIILLAACQEGLGEEVFERWILNAPNPESMVTKIQQQFELGGHKAAAIAMVMQKATVCLVSEFTPEFTKRIFMTPFPTLQAALDHALQKHGTDASILVMPYGGSTLPVIIS
ncbi:nickel-dependent lactate racemase [candidate division KSB3 bacterium]|uniref:Nickel-dependent lactate racemase n=1 Tax=candidate division KSB3 bacterium TaxID=2044937 RepID=A0A9D5JWL3_9BACT|nr:nickel-dependent lactate racemase [candidate division KSB3 bacterium]MBD3325460.1 nickel-dependent lactate racemase [candidate division KSB3 bacterium]